MTTVRVQKGDYGKAITFTITNPDTGAAVNISTATGYTITVGRIGNSTKLIDGKALAFTDDGSDGQLDWTPAAGDLDTAGYYDVDIKLTYDDPAQEIVQKFTLHIVDTV